MLRFYQELRCFWTNDWPCLIYLRDLAERQARRLPRSRWGDRLNIIRNIVEIVDDEIDLYVPADIGRSLDLAVLRQMTGSKPIAEPTFHDHVAIPGTCAFLRWLSNTPLVRTSAEVQCAIETNANFSEALRVRARDMQDPRRGGCPLRRAMQNTPPPGASVRLASEILALDMESYSQNIWDTFPLRRVRRRYTTSD